MIAAALRLLARGLHAFADELAVVQASHEPVEPAVSAAMHFYSAGQRVASSRVRERQGCQS